MDNILNIHFLILWSFQVFTTCNHYIFFNTEKKRRMLPPPLLVQSSPYGFAPNNRNQSIEI